jgi:glutamine synthetase
MRMMKDGHNCMLQDGVLSGAARKAIAGMMVLAPSITAFGNKNPMSYFRLVPHQEAPTNVCWGDRNRSVLVRVPLGWAAKKDMCEIANPLEEPSHFDTSIKQTVEMRSPDGSADLYQLLAGLAVACRHGFEMEDAEALAEKTYVNVDIHRKENEEKLKPGEPAQLLRSIRSVQPGHDRRHHQAPPRLRRPHPAPRRSGQA